MKFPYKTVIAAGLAIAVLLGVYNIYVYFFTSIKTQVALYGSIETGVSARGYIIRDEHILVNEDGRLNNVATVRGRKNALKDLYERMKGNQCFDKLGYVFISHADCMEDAETLATMVREEYPAVEVVISDIGPVIGAHTGPGGIALCFLGNTIKGE